VVSVGDDRHIAYVERVELKRHDLRGDLARWRYEVNNPAVARVGGALERVRLIY
jgi:hypothetical protein